jgi:hypothetical protein
VRYVWPTLARDDQAHAGERASNDSAARASRLRPGSHSSDDGCAGTASEEGRVDCYTAAAAAAADARHPEPDERGNPTPSDGDRCLPSVTGDSSCLDGRPRTGRHAGHVAALPGRRPSPAGGPLPYVRRLPPDTQMDD